MFSLNSKLGMSFKQKELLFLVSFLKKIPPTLVAQLCQASTSKNISKELVESIEIPSLPVQSLDQVMEKYLKSVKPFVSTNQWEKTKTIVHNFCQNEKSGKKLQRLLEERAQSTENWLSDWWLSVAYLDYRNPVVVFSSPGLVWPERKFKNQNEQLLYAAHLIGAALDFNKLIELKQIPQEKLGGKHLLDMSQYEKIFGTCRIPNLPSDDLLFQNPQKPSTNIIVMYNNHLFSLPVFEDIQRQPLSVATFYGMLKKVVEEGDKEPGIPIGLLTTEHRDHWAKLYMELKKNKINKHLIEEYIEKALFVVCLDKPLTLGSGLNYGTRCSKLLLHGFGQRGNASNRWYDKTIQFIVGALNDGVGIAYEHSPAEGGPIGVLTDFVMEKTKSISDLTAPLSYPNPQKLEIFASDLVKEGIESAGKAVDKISDELDVYGWSFSHFGKERIKSLKVSPDSFVQIGIQLAFYKLHNHPAAQYESGSLRKYKHGRTDTIRSCSEEVVRFCQIMTNPKAPSEEKERTLQTALAAHKNYAAEVIEGRGVDRHLLALKILAKLHKMENPEIFSDVAYQRSTYYQLSTSNVFSKSNGFMVYGPLVDDGYACCYNIRSENINFGTSAWSTCRQTRLSGFAEALEESLLQMENCLSKILVKSKL